MMEREVLKAFACKAGECSGVGGKCRECKYHNGNFICNAKMIYKDVLRLIKRYKKRNKELKRIIKEIYNEVTREIEARCKDCEENSYNDVSLAYLEGKIDGLQEIADLFEKFNRRVINNDRA